MTLLEVSGVSVSFDGFRAINGLSFAIGEPELRAVIGPMQMLGKAPRDLRYFTPAQLERSVQGAGFEILETTTAPKRPPARFIVARRR